MGPYYAFAHCIVVTLIATIKADIEGCDYFDTVDLTNSRKFENGSYQYNDLIIPKDKVGRFNYQILASGKEPVAEHMRGCACQVKSCIRFCCDPQKLLIEGTGLCEGASGMNYSSLLNITMNGESEVEKSVFEFIVQQHIPLPCTETFALNPSTNEDHGWTLFDNGTLFFHKYENLLSKEQYCLQPIQRPNGDFPYSLLVHLCSPPTEKTNSYIQVVSVFFMIIIIAVYKLLPKFKCVHGKCCTCYFSCLTGSYLALFVVIFGWVDKQNPRICFLIGYIGYYIVMATFLWLLIINYNLWKTFNNIGVGRKSRFIKYNIFVWSTAAILTLITSTIDVLNDAVDEGDGIYFYLWKPRVGIDSCWINVYDWSASIYYYGPIGILVLCNSVLFIKTAKRIFIENRKNRRQLKKSDSQHNLRNLTNFEMFLRLFVIVGVVWILEIVSYISLLSGIESFLITIIDAITSSQGIILFLATILKKDVWTSIVQRVRETKAPNESSLMSSSSQQPTTEIALIPRTPRSSTTGTMY